MANKKTLWGKTNLVKVNQWLATWDKAIWSPEEDLPKPDKSFYLGAVPLKTLRGLAGVSRRQIEERRRRNPTPGYQRAHEIERSQKIARYLSYGYPLSTQKSLDPDNHRDLVHPGWLPTSILVNIIPAGQSRRRKGKDLTVKPQHAVKIVSDKDGRCSLRYPLLEDGDSVGKGNLEPIEVIDGQHRLFAVDHLEDLGDEYEVPVVIFNNLSHPWQAYLFWVINVEPKKINPSLAFDLYPELRSQSWLERGEGIKVYQEHRAQELTEILWRHPESVWRDRIELHGNRIDGHVSNAAFIRSLMASFVRRWGKENRIGGLFGSMDEDGAERVLPWKRGQQAAFLIRVWWHVHEAVKKTRVAWAQACREAKYADDDAKKKVNPHGLDEAFAGPHTLLGTDQGVRVVMVVFNALCQVHYGDLELEEWEIEAADSPEDDEVTSVALEELVDLKSAEDFLAAVSRELVSGKVDWRTSSAPQLNPDQQAIQAGFRGSGGYSMLQKRVLEALTKSANKDVSRAAKKVVELGQ